MTLKQRILKLLGEGTPMLSMDMAIILRVSNGAASEAAKELNRDKYIHVTEWRKNAKNGGNKVYKIGAGIDVVKPQEKMVRTEPIDKLPFKPHADVAAA